MKIKLLFICVLALAVTTVAFGQQKRIADASNKQFTKSITHSSASPSIAPLSAASAPAVIWEDDFSNPANWVIAHDPTACSLDWQIGVNSCTGWYQINDIVSTTASNGWAMIDSDAYGGQTGGN